MWRGLILVMAAVMLAACTSSSGPYVQMLPGRGVQTEGSVTTRGGSFVKYPDGAVVRVATIEQVKSHRCAEGKRGDTCLLVQVRLQNKGNNTLEFGDYGASLDLYYGQNGYLAREDGYMGDPGIARFPRQCVPGSSVTVGDLFAVPTTELGHLELTFKASLADGTQYTPYTFTDVQTLLR